MHFASFYAGNGLSPNLRACLRSWVDFGHEIDVYTYDPDVALPPGVRRLDANEIITSDRVYTYRRGVGTTAGSVSAFSNEFRYRMVHARDVVWVDTDVLCLRADWPEREYYIAWETQRRDKCNVGVFGAPPDSELLALLLEMVDDVDYEHATHGAAGPEAATTALDRLGLNDLPAPFTEYYSINYRECRAFMDPARHEEVLERTSDSLAIHLWDEVWTRGRIPTFLRPPKGSFMEAVLARHGIAIPIEATFEQLNALDFDEPTPTVPLEQYEELERWALSLQEQLLNRPPSEFTSSRFRRAKPRTSS